MCSFMTSVVREQLPGTELLSVSTVSEFVSRFQRKAGGISNDRYSDIGCFQEKSTGRKNSITGRQQGIAVSFSTSASYNTRDSVLFDLTGDSS